MRDHQLVASSDSDNEAPGVEDHKGKYILKDSLPDFLSHMKCNMGFPEEEMRETSPCSLLGQFHNLAPLDLVVHPDIMEVLRRERKDPDKIILPRFMAILYPLQDMQQTLPDSVPTDSFVASLVGRTSLTEDDIIKDSTDKKVDSALNNVHSGSHLALGTGICGTYVSQSLISDIKQLFHSLEDFSDSSWLLDYIEKQVEYMSNIDLDRMQARPCQRVPALQFEGPWDSKTGARIRLRRLLLSISLFTQIFGEEIEEKMHKFFKDKKRSSSLKQTAPEKQPLKHKSPFHQSFCR
ncbi:hypothetical protein NDU88_011285 [Pleurodeles waltl]|uniref:Uncharacterized protein n=1 Tax=Pleurodeles waltl TaxID=8319 RepID=A0AAV7Q166_PLEWA|nr:hypothetical protein NDU88_011285 [Pleurodeles waltl]